MEGIVPYILLRFCKSLSDEAIHSIAITGRASSFIENQGGYPEAVRNSSSSVMTSIFNFQTT